MAINRKKTKNKKRKRKKRKEIEKDVMVYSVLPFNRFTSGTKRCLKQKRDLKRKFGTKRDFGWR